MDATLGTAASRLERLVTISLLGIGRDTAAARAFQELGEAPDFDFDRAGWALVDQLAARVGPAGRPFKDRVVRARERARQAIADGASLGCALLSVLDPLYPEWLRHVPDPPIVLWTRGAIEALRTPAVAIVGSRQAGPASLAIAWQLGRELAEAGLAVVSGLARGIDGAAHRGAIDADGQTVAVVGNGVDVAYPAEHRALMSLVTQSGAVVSEFPPGTRPLPSHFPLRNRIISGLSRAVVVVEASDRSGSLITARAALEQGRDVLAVPGPVAAGTHRGCHALIKDGARLVETVDDILEELGRPRPRRGDSVGHRKRLVRSDLDEFFPPGSVVTVDDLAQRSGREVSAWLADLAVLEVDGIVARAPGGGFVRLDGPATNIGKLDRGNRWETGRVHGQSARRRRIAGQGEDD